MDDVISYYEQLTSDGHTCEEAYRQCVLAFSESMRNGYDSKIVIY